LAPQCYAIQECTSTTASLVGNSHREYVRWFSQDICAPEIQALAAEVALYDAQELSPRAGLMARG
jgi:hypothetical protein